MPEFEFPSATFPAPPGVSLRAPEDWSSTQAPGAVLAVVAAAEMGRFAPNVIVTVTRHSRDFDFDTLLDDVAAEAVEREGSASEPPMDTELGGRTFHGRTIAIQDPTAGTLAQVHLATRVDYDDAADVVHLVGTCSGDRVAEDIPAINAVLATVTVTPSISE